MSKYLISADFADYEAGTIFTWNDVPYTYNTMDPEKDAAFSELAMALFNGSPEEVTVLAGSYEASLTGGWFTNGAAMTITNQKYSTEATPVYADTAVTVDAVLNNTGSFTVANADASEEPATISCTVTTLNNSGSLNVNGATFEVTTLNNTGSVAIEDGDFRATDITNAEGTTFTLTGSKFTAESAIENAGIFNISSSEVDAEFDGGEINLTGMFGDDTEISGDAEITATSVILNGDASVEASKLTVAGSGIDLNGTASLFADEVVLNARIYANGVNTLVLDDITGSAIISARTGAELADSYVDRTVFFSNNTTISGDSYIKIISIKGTSIDPASSGYRSLTITGDLESDKIDTGTSSGDKPNSAFITFDEADATLGTLSITKDSVITVDNSSVTATSVILSGNIVVLGDSSLNFASITPSSAAIAGDSTINAGGATLSDTSIAAKATVAVAAETNLTLAGENTILSTIDNAGTITLVADGTENAKLIGDVTGNVVIANGAVDLSTVKAAQVIKGSVTGANIVNNTGNYKHEDVTGYYLTTESKATLFVNSEYGISEGSAITADGHIFGYNAFSSLATALASVTANTTTITLTSDSTFASPVTLTQEFEQDLTIGGEYTATFAFSGNNDLILSTDENVTITLAEGTILKTIGADGYIVLGGEGSYDVQGTVNSVSQVAFWTDAEVSGSIVSKYTVPNTGMVLFRSAYQGSGDGVLLDGGTVETGRALLVSGELTADGAEFTASVLRFTQNLNEVGAAWWAEEVVNDEGIGLLGAKFVLNSTDSVWTIGSIEAAHENAKIDGEFTFTGDEINVSGNADLGATITLKLIDSDMTVDGTLSNAGIITLGTSGNPSDLSAGTIENTGTINVLWGSNLDADELVNAEGTVSVRGQGSQITIDDLDGTIEIATTSTNFTSVTGSFIGEDTDDTDDVKGIVEVKAASTGKIFFLGNNTILAEIQNNTNNLMNVGGTTQVGALTAGTITNAEGASFTVNAGSELIGATIVNAFDNSITVKGTLDGVTVQGGSIVTTDGFAFEGTSVLEGVTINRAVAELTVDGALTVDTASSITVSSVTVEEGGFITVKADAALGTTPTAIFTLHSAEDAADLMGYIKEDGAVVACQGNVIYALKGSPITNNSIVVNAAWAEGKEWGDECEVIVGGQTVTYYYLINAFSTFTDALEVAADREAATTISVLSNITDEVTNGLYTATLKGNVTVDGDYTVTLNLGDHDFRLLAAKADTTFTFNPNLVLNGNVEDDWGWFILGRKANPNQNVEGNYNGVFTINGTLAPTAVQTYAKAAFADIESEGEIRIAGIDSSVGDAATDAYIAFYKDFTVTGALSADYFAFYAAGSVAPTASITTYDAGTKIGENNYIVVEQNGTLLISGGETAPTIPQVQTGSLMLTKGTISISNSNIDLAHNLTWGDDWSRYSQEGDPDFETNVVLNSTETTWTIGDKLSTLFDTPADHIAETASCTFNFNGDVITVGKIDNTSYQRSYDNNVAVIEPIENGPVMTINLNASMVEAGNITNDGTINVGVSYGEGDDKVYDDSSIEVEGAVTNNGTIHLTGAKVGSTTHTASLTADSITNNGMFTASYSTINVVATEPNADAADYVFQSTELGAVAGISNSTLTAGYLKGNFTLTNDDVTAQIVNGTLNFIGTNTLALGKKDGNVQTGDMSGATFLLQDGAAISGTIYAADTDADFAGGTIETAGPSATIGDLNAAKTKLVNATASLEIKDEATVAYVDNSETINIVSTADDKSTDADESIDASLTAGAIDNAGTINVGTEEGVAASLTGSTITNTGIINAYSGSVIETELGIVSDAEGEDAAEINLVGSTIAAADGVYLNLGNGKFSADSSTITKLGINTAYATAPDGELAEIILKDSTVSLGTANGTSVINAAKAKTFTIEGDSKFVGRIQGTVTLLDETTLTDSTIIKYGNNTATIKVADDAEVTFSGANTVSTFVNGGDVTVDGSLTTGALTNNDTITVDGSLKATSISKVGDIVMDATDTLTVTNAIAGEGTIAITGTEFELNKALITAGSGLSNTTITINNIEVGNGDTVLGAYTVIKTDKMLSLVELASTETLYVNKDYSATDAGGHAWGINAFVFLTSAINNMADDTETIVVESSRVATGLSNVTVAPKVGTLEITGEDVDVELGFKGADQGLYLTPGVDISGVNITTTATDGDAWTGSVYVNYAAAAGTVTIDGDITAAGHIYFCGSADVTGDLATTGDDSQILLRSGKADDGLVTIDGSAITGNWIMMISGETRITDSSVTIGSLGYDNYADTDDDPVLGSTNSNWTIGEIDLVHKQTAPDVAFVDATINLDNSEFKVTGSENTNTEAPEVTEAAEIGKAITINLVNASTISVAEGTLKNAGVITTDETETVISAKDIVNAMDTSLISAGSITATGKIDNYGVFGTGSAEPVYGIQVAGDLTATGAITNGKDIEITQVAEKAVIRAKNITAGSITNYGMIGSQTADLKHTLATITLGGNLVNGQYGNIFANKLIAASLDNSNEVLVNVITIDGLIDNKAGAAIALNQGEGSTGKIDITAGTINNAGYIKTLEGGSIKVTTALVNDVYEASALAKGYIVTDSIDAGSITNNGKIEVGSIVTGGAIDNEGIIEVGSIVAGGTIGNTGTFIASGAEKAITTNRFTNDGSVTLKGGVSLGTADAKVALVGNSKNATKFEILDASIYATQFQNADVLTIDGGTTGATFNVGTVKNGKTNTITISGKVALTIANVQGGTNYKGITLDGAVLTDASVGGAAVTTVANDSVFNGISSFSNLTVADDVELTINAAAKDCLTVTGNLNSTGTIYLHAEDGLFADENPVRVITVDGEFNVNSITTDDGYSVIIQDKDVYLLNGAPESMATIVLDITWGTAVPIGQSVNFGGDVYTYGVDAFTWATQLVNLTTDTTLIKFRTSEESYGALNLARTDVSVPGSTVAPLKVVVTRVDGTGVGTEATFDDTKISTDVNFDVQDITFADLTISGSTVNFDLIDTKSVTAEDLLIKDGSKVDFEGNVEIGGATISNSRVNFGEEDKEALTTIAGNVTITNADVDFDDVTEIGIEGSEDPVLVKIEGDSEVEFDRNTTIYGNLTLAADSVIEANQGYTFTVGSAEINGTFLAGNEDDENLLGNTTVDLGTLTGSGNIYTDINSGLTFSGAGFTGKTYINVSGLTASTTSPKEFAITNVADEDVQFVVTGDSVAKGTSFRKYFDYDINQGLIQKHRAANVYEATVSTQTQINDAVSGTGWAADGSAVDPIYFVDNVTLTANGGFTAGTAVYLDVNDDQNVILDGYFNVGVYGGTYTEATTTRFGTYLGGDIYVTVEAGSTFDKVVVGGDRINVNSGRAVYYRADSEGSDNLASINLTIDGGTFKNYVATGILYQGENLQGSVEVGSTNLKINGGTFAKDVYGGNYGNKKAASSCTFVESSNVTLTVGGEQINMAGCLFVGSFGSGKVETTHLTLAGKSADALVVKEIWGGCGSDYYKEEGTKRTYETAVSGDRKLSFTGFDAEISASRIAGFSSVEVLGNGEELLDDDRIDTNATLQGTVRLSDVENWKFEAGSTLNGAFINDFEGDTLTLTGIGEYFAAYETNSWTLFGDTTNFTNFDKFDSVSYGTTEFDFNGSAWVAADNSYMLSIDTESKAMILSTIA